MRHGNVGEHRTKKLVAKIGSASLAVPGGGLDEAFMLDLASQVGQLMSSGWQVLLVSSGAVRSGLQLLKLDEAGPLPLQQAVAAVGQSMLMKTYERVFNRVQLKVGQVLLSRDDLSDRTRYLNARACLDQLLALKVVPIINENDTVAVEELCFGDNDQLAARVAAMVDAELLVLLSDVEGLYSDADTRAVIPEVKRVDDSLFELDFGKRDAFSRGGMQSKLQAASLATRAGTEVLLALARRPKVLIEAAEHQHVGTRFLPDAHPLPSRKRWLAYGRVQRGLLKVNEGARQALVSKGKSLLAAGVVSLEGEFEAGDLVEIADESGEVFARGLVRYSSSQLVRVVGMRSQQASETLGKAFVCDEVVHRDDMVVNSQEVCHLGATRGNSDER